MRVTGSFRRIVEKLYGKIFVVGHSLIYFRGSFEKGWPESGLLDQGRGRAGLKIWDESYQQLKLLPLTGISRSKGI